MSSLSTKPRQRRCKFSGCRDYFVPKRFNLVLEECCSAGCKLSFVEESANKAKVKLKPKKKLKTAAKLKTELWPIFSLHQKLVHSSDGKWCQCYTCDKPLEIGTTNCQGGHALSKAAYKNLYFDERAVRPQCYYCNINLGGMHYDFCEKLKLEIGAESFEEMKLKGKDIVKRDRFWYLEKIKYYSAQNVFLKKLKIV